MKHNIIHTYLVIEVAIVWSYREFSQYHITRASFFNLSISWSTEERITPACLLGGSVTWTTSKSDLISTFRSCGLSFFITFDFAFIMFGRVAYLGWFSLKSVLQQRKSQNMKARENESSKARRGDFYVITAGKSKLKVSRPPSTSLSTVATLFPSSSTT